MDDYIITDKDFKLFADLVYKKTGISLQMGKKQLLQSRLGKVLRKREINSYREYYEIVANDSSGEELIELINLVSTNVTNFFREEKHFEFMRNVWYPNFEFSHANPVKIWCAASSSGEEPYSLSITMMELVGDKYPYEIFASDISMKVLNMAKRGVYPNKNIENLDSKMVKKYFQAGKGKAEGYVKIKKEIQRCVKFERINLIEPFKHPHNFDLIFCRNVMIYFDMPTKEAIVNKFYNYMNKGAYLMIGHSESLNGLSHPFQYVQPATYRKVK